MLSHDVSFVSECCKSVTVFKPVCKPVTVFKTCGKTLENAQMFCSLVEAASKEVQYDALTKPQQGRVNVAMTREWDKWNEFGVTKFCPRSS